MAFSRAMLLSFLIFNAAHTASALVISSQRAQKDAECGMANPLHLTVDPTLLVEKVAKVAGQNPGAGMDPITPFQVVLKDGFSKIDCVKDHMYVHGDKFGPNKHDYQASIAVSIVHYNNYVAKEDRKAMTPKVCFEFCKSVPDMLFFGILNGNKCYCEPFYKQIAGDSSMCDTTCPGSPSEMCGGVSKSNVFAMHSCAK